MINFRNSVNRSLLTLVLCLMMCMGVQAQTYLVKDLNQAPESGIGGSVAPSEIVGVNGVSFFVNYTHMSGAELWKTDGTDAGTRLVKDIWPGHEGSLPENLINVNGNLFFTAKTRQNGRELWKSDGTEAGTVLVKDLNSLVNGLDGNPQNLFNANGTLYFYANDLFGSLGLLKSDGTEAGTLVVSSNVHYPGNWAYRNGEVFFSGSSNKNNSDNELWKTDGTPGGTVVVKDISVGSGSSAPYALININGTIFFGASDGLSGTELWKTDGTSAGTKLVHDISNNADGSFPWQFANVNGTLFFTATTVNQGYELWKSNGTSAGTVLVKDIYPGTGHSAPELTAVINNTLYFTANDGVNGTELWKSDGAQAGTQMVADIVPGPGSFYPNSMAVLNDVLYFANNADAELWRSDGTGAGTYLLKEINAAGYAGVSNVTNINNRIFFYADDGIHGYELWKSDGTPASTVLIKDAAEGTAGSYFGEAAILNGIQYFVSFDDEHGKELWRTDGTAQGTYLVRDILPGGEESQPKELRNINGVLYFIISIQVSGKYQIWKSDGTEAGTVPVSAPLSSIEYLTPVNNTLYFAGGNSEHGVELWKCDLATGKTVMVKDINSGTASSGLFWLVNAGGVLFFSADAGNGTGNELWKCDDGTAAGTVMVKDIHTNGGSTPHELTPIGNVVYFNALEANGDYEVWKSDGTAVGTVKVKDIHPGAEGSFPSYLTNLNGVLCFEAAENDFDQLWRSDGTESGTTMIKDIYPGGSDSPGSLTKVGDVIYFVWRSHKGMHADELWKTDGTGSGTVLVEDINSGNFFVDGVEFFPVDDKLFFIAENRLWKSEGTECSTMPLTDVSEIEALRIIGGANNKLFFTGINNANGEELFYYDFSNVKGECEQTITFAPLKEKMYGDPSFSLEVDSTSGLPVTLSSNNRNVATITGNTVTIVGAGETIITASQPGNKDYSPATEVTQVLTVNKGTQSITFEPLPVKSVDDVFDISAAASSGLTISFVSADPAIATISGNTVKLTGVGTATVIASQPGDGNYAPAIDVERTLIVNKKTQVITFSELQEKILGEDPFFLVGTASSGLPVTYTSSNPDVATVYDTRVTIKAEGVTNITAFQSGNATYEQATPVVHELVVKLITGNELSPDQAIAIYPNPTADYVTIETGGTGGEKTLRVLDVYGRKRNVTVMPVDGYSYKVDMNSLSPGIYYLQINEGLNHITRRIVKK